MNERIRQLADDADKCAWAGGNWFEADFREKFAELIVAECMQIIKVDMYEDAISNMWSKNKLQMIKQHFGVAE